jgi:hypothetical protein
MYLRESANPNTILIYLHGVPVQPDKSGNIFARVIRIIGILLLMCVKSTILQCTRIKNNFHSFFPKKFVVASIGFAECLIFLDLDTYFIYLAAYPVPEISGWSGVAL